MHPTTRWGPSACRAHPLRSSPSPSATSDARAPRSRSTTHAHQLARPLAEPTPTHSQPPTPTPTPTPHHNHHANSASTTPTPQPTPCVILYDQNDNAGTNGVNSQMFAPPDAAFDNQAADDFVVPGGQTWTVQQVVVTGSYFNGAGPAPSFNVYFYNDAATFPGAAVAAKQCQRSTRYETRRRRFHHVLTVERRAYPRHLLGFCAGQHGLQRRRPVGLDGPDSYI